MAPWKKVLRACCLAAAFLWSAPYLFLYLLGKPLIAEQIQRISGHKAAVEDFVIFPDMSIDAGKISIADFGSIKHLHIVPNIFAFMTGRAVFNLIEIKQPVFTYTRTALMSSSGESPAAVRPPAMLLFPSEGIHLPWAFPVIIKQLSLKNGTIHFIDNVIKNGHIALTINDVDLNVRNLTAAYPVITQFRFNGWIPWERTEEKGNVLVDGWVNFFKNDIQAKVEVTDIDGIALQPYYLQHMQNFNLEEASIEKANLNFKSDIQGLDNDVTVKCRLELTNIVRTVRGPDQPKKRSERIADAVIHMLKSPDEGKMAVEFTFKTHMDRPAFGLGIIKRAVEDKFTHGRGENPLKPGNIILFPGRMIVGVMFGVTEVSKAMIDGSFAVGNEFKKAIQGSFDKK